MTVLGDPNDPSFEVRSKLESLYTDIRQFEDELGLSPKGAGGGVDVMLPKVTPNALEYKSRLEALIDPLPSVDGKTLTLILRVQDIIRSVLTTAHTVREHGGNKNTGAAS